MSEQHIPGCTLAFKLVHVSSSVIIVGGLWTAPMSGQPTFDSQGPRKSVKTLTTISFTSWIPASSQLFGLAGIQYEKNIQPDGFSGIQILQNSSLRRSPGRLVGWGVGYSFPIPISREIVTTTFYDLNEQNYE